MELFNIKPVLLQSAACCNVPLACVFQNCIQLTSRYKQIFFNWSSDSDLHYKVFFWLASIINIIWMPSLQSLCIFHSVLHVCAVSMLYILKVWASDKMYGTSPCLIYCMFQGLLRPHSPELFPNIITRLSQLWCENFLN